MDERILDPDGARKRLAAWKGRIDKLAADTKSMSEQLQGLRIKANDQEGMAEVTIDSTGTMVDLKLTDRIGKATPETVAATIMATLNTARRQLSEKSREILADTVGTESAAAKAIVDSVSRGLQAEPRKPVRNDDDQAERTYTEERW